MGKRFTTNSLKNDQRGLITVVALIIFSLLSVFGIIVQSTVIDTYRNIRNINNYYAARDLADSLTEYLQAELNSHESGFNQDINCTYSNGSPVTGSDSLICKGDGILDLMQSYEDVEIDLEIVGRGLAEETLKVCGGAGGSLSILFGGAPCYITPKPGTGTAGARCSIYEPDYEATTSSTDVIPTNLAGGNYNEIAQIDYSCNWNKLQFGSSVTEGAVIPLFYDDGTNIVSPFYDDGSGANNDFFVLRMRTPCLPCVYEDRDLSPGINRLCTLGQDNTVCTDDERYELEDELDGDQVVVQWQISGICDDGRDCTVIPYLKMTTQGNYEDKFSGITDKIINENQFAGHTLGDNIAIFLDSPGLNFFDAILSSGNFERSTFYSLIRSIQKPALTIALNDALISDNNEAIPYLEYQIMSTQPISDSKAEISATINVNGNIFQKTLFKQEEKPLVDFAIQN